MVVIKPTACLLLSTATLVLSPHAAAAALVADLNSTSSLNTASCLPGSTLDISSKLAGGLSITTRAAMAASVSADALAATVAVPTDRARTADVSPIDSLARQDVLRNTLIGVLGLILSAASLVVAIYYNHQKAHRERDLESSPAVFSNNELEDLDGRRMQQRGDQSPENAEASTTDFVPLVGPDSRGGEIANNPGEDASSKIQEVVRKAWHLISGIVMPITTAFVLSMLKQKHSVERAQQLPSHNVSGQTLESVIGTQRGATKCSD